MGSTAPFGGDRLSEISSRGLERRASLAQAFEEHERLAHRGQPCAGSELTRELPGDLCSQASCGPAARACAALARCRIQEPVGPFGDCPRQSCVSSLVGAMPENERRIAGSSARDAWHVATKAPHVSRTAPLDGSVARGEFAHDPRVANLVSRRAPRCPHETRRRPVCPELSRDLLESSYRGCFFRSRRFARSTLRAANARARWVCIPA